MNRPTKPARLRRRVGARLAVAGVLALLGLLATAGSAAAHPLGNFSVNHYDGLTLRPDSIELLSIVDTAEIPTRQQRPALDLDDDQALSDDELAAAAAEQCPRLRNSLETTVDGRAIAWELDDARLVAPPGAAGLPTLRLTCRLHAAVDLPGRSTIEFRHPAPDRVGWREITAEGADDLALVDSPVPATSISDQLRTYPEERLSSPLDETSVVLTTAPGRGGTGADRDELTAAGDPFSRFIAAGDRLLEDTIGRDDLTVLVGAVAVLLAMLLGAGHAVLPGHGKTVMAAYLAGRRGTRTDAFVVGATVTLTHTAGVLVLGLVISLGSAIAGEAVLQRLGVIGGILIAGIGASLLRDALRSRRTARAPDDTHAPAHELASVGAHGHGGHAHDHGHGHDHGQGHDHGHGHAHPDPRFSRRGLVGMAMAGGLVPSPSALVVLLGSVALGRTLFGVSLVLAYGLGMAATLVAVGLILVRLRTRLDGVARDGRVGRAVTRASAWLPVGTAVLVLLVGVGLVVRGVVLSA